MLRETLCVALAAASFFAVAAGSQPRPPATAPAVASTTAPATAPVLSADRARYAVHELALNHPNPYIRQTAYYLYDANWLIDLPRNAFTLTLIDPKPDALSGTFALVGADYWVASFTDDGKFREPWIPPADTPFTLDQARTVLLKLCADWAVYDPLTTLLGDELKSATTQPSDNADVTVLQTGTRGSGTTWHINAKARVFRITDIRIDFGHEYEGKFGWDEKKHWTAWFTRYATIRAGRSMWQLATPKSPVIPSSGPSPVSTSSRPSAPR